MGIMKEKLWYFFLGPDAGRQPVILETNSSMLRTMTGWAELEVVVGLKLPRWFRDNSSENQRKHPSMGTHPTAQLWRHTCVTLQIGNQADVPAKGKTGGWGSKNHPHVFFSLA